MKTISKKNLLFLHIILLLYSTGSIFSKIASGQEFLSFKFIIYYGAVLFILFLYAICWQQVLKKISLTTAFVNKAITIVWGMIFGKIIFGEAITFLMIIGSVIIFIGIYLVVTSNE